ncbi:MAG: helix-turn-helix transcriptional regulator [Bacteroidia bacterium]|nr:helix-turn-helix transcriptional regulator [Bacteroidia bacterium]MDW8300872.1 helix-turn-helix transcriptional regulator [Bacteroidia bacterium]
MDLESYTEEIYHKIVQQIRAVRRKKGIQQRQMAEALGMNQVSYSDAENGKTRFTVTRLFAAVKYLGIDLATILKEVNFFAEENSQEESKNITNVIAEVTQHTTAQSTQNYQNTNTDNYPLSLQTDLHELVKAVLIQNNAIQKIKKQNKLLHEQNQELKQDLQEIKQILSELLSQAKPNNELNKNTST